MTTKSDLDVSVPDRGLAVVLFRPKFAENVGSVARACLNMGCERIVLVDPQNYAPERAMPLATIHAAHLLEQATHARVLSEALAGFTQVYGTTARMGGWRRRLLGPAQAAAMIAGQVRDGHEVALLFGPEDKGLTNAQIKACTHLVHIPTARPGVSLNLAQAALILLYECQSALAANAGTDRPPVMRHATHAEQEALFAALQGALTAIDFIRGDNPDYWMLRIRGIVQRMGLRRDEFNVLMGVCRQLNHAFRGLDRVGKTRRSGA